MNKIPWILIFAVLFQYSCNNAIQGQIKGQAAENVVLTDDMENNAITVDIDLGVIDNVTEMTSNVPIKNETSGTIKLVPTVDTPRNIDSPFDVKADPWVLEPGEQGKISLTFDPFYMEGEVNKRIEYGIENSAVERIVINLNAMVQKKLEFVTKSLLYHPTKVSEPANVIIQHAAGYEPKIELKDAHIFSNYKVHKSDTETRFELQLKETYSLGNSQLEFTINDDRLVIIPVPLTMQDKIVTEPEFIMYVKDMAKLDVKTVKNRIHTKCHCSHIQILNEVEGMEFEISTDEKNYCVLVTTITDVNALKEATLKLQCEEEIYEVPIVIN